VLGPPTRRSRNDDAHRARCGCDAMRLSLVFGWIVITFVCCMAVLAITWYGVSSHPLKTSAEAFASRPVRSVLWVLPVAPHNASVCWEIPTTGTCSTDGTCGKTATVCKRLPSNVDEIVLRGDAQ